MPTSRLLLGIHRFQNEVFPAQRELFQKLAEVQKPDWLFITCSDSRVQPQVITQTEPGELFTLRNAGNLVPPFGSAPSGEAATIEFAVEALGVKHIIVSGHSDCGAIKALLDPHKTEKLPAVREWLRYAEATRRIATENYSHLEGQKLLELATMENVLVQLGHLRTLPAVAAALQRGALQLHGCFYRIETGEVLGYVPERDQFISVKDFPVDPK